MLLSGLLITGCAPGAASQGATTRTTTEVGFHGNEPDQPRSRPSFVLRDTSGKRYDFAAETGGRPTLLYFGYTNCPDECPTAMADVAAALRQAPAELREDVVVVFVTTDPERDDPALLRRWLDMFSTEAVGLTGTQAEVDAAQATLSLLPALKGEDVATLPGRPDEHEHAPGTAAHVHLGPLGYGVDHTNMLFGFDTADRLPVVYPAGVRPADIAADLPLLAQGDAP
jgi:protein SCO1/2